MKLIYSSQPGKISEELLGADPRMDVTSRKSHIKNKIMWKVYSSAILLSVIQIQLVLATGCNIVSVTSPSASTLNVVWSSYSGATVYLLDLRVVNSTSVAPVVVTPTAPSTQRLIQGLRPGHLYQVTMKVFQFTTVQCTDVELAMTVPATSQITFSKAISSTSIKFEWSSVIGADNYILFVEKLFSYPPQKYNQTFTMLGGQVDGLTPSTTYNCYLYSSNSAGRGAKSSIKTIMTLVQPPDGVVLESTGKSTARITWNAVSKVLLYQVTVTDSDPSNAPVVRNTSTTSMDISNLEPCSTYTVGVSSVNVFLVPGEPYNVLHTTSNINPVTNISVDYSCSSGMVTVTWALVFGANSYRATAVDSTGASLNCTSASTSCHITMLKCGEKYHVHVTVISDDCENSSNTSALFETVPCAPANPRTIHDCSSNVIVFSWQPTNNTFYYVATAEDITGKVKECRTADNSCYFTNTGCGQFYKYNVYAVSHCKSEVSQPEFVRTSPCLPTNVRTGAECQSDMLITTWDSALGALSYTVEAQGNTGKVYNCTSSSNSCAVTGVPCGEHLSVWITASNDKCSTNRVLGEVAQTVPCPPTNVLVSVNCSQDSARLNWTSSIGVIFYIAVAEDAGGNTHTCNSMGTNCLIEGLSCGQNYTASIIGTNLKCNSSASGMVDFMTAPCPPTHIEAFRDCDANHALIVWQNHQPTGLYTATIEELSGAQLNCTSNTVNNCKITSLPCGKRYNVSVTYSDGNCPSTSAPIKMDSVPCGPENVSASVACVTGELTVTWDISVPAENYTAIISRGRGQPLHCNSSEMQCTTGALVCGSSYMVVVLSVTGTCFSLPSAEVTVQALLCPPTNVTTVHTCAPDPVPVAWTPSDSAKIYTAVAVSVRGHRSECTTNQTSCSLPGLQCGEVYTVGVSGTDDNCTSQLSDTVSLNTEPCPPSNVSSQLICSAAMTHMSWAASMNAASYALTATSNGQTLTCSSTSPNCTLSSLPCGQAYDILVTATDGTCVSNYSAPFRQEEVPCAPANISTHLLCGTDDLMASWIPTAPSLSYHVTAVPLTGNMTSITCDTSLANCSLSGLQCGQTYNVSARASSGSCSGPYSQPQTVQAAPCPPQGLRASTGCGTNSLQAFWNASLGATSSTVTVTGPNGFSETCSTSDLTCSVSGVRCASQYNVRVTSQDNHCASSPTQVVMTTGPCDPANVTGVVQCSSDMATVSWPAAPGAIAYTVFAQENGSQHYTSCRSNMTSCQLYQLQCGKVYSLTVMAEDDACNSTGNISATMMTAPCSPSIQNTTLICHANSSSLSWTPMAGATGYVVNATATNGHAVSCSSAIATCTLTDLLCSETYTATITARGGQCDSAPSSSTSIITSPCPPAIISKHYTCGNDMAELRWTDPMGSLSFQAQVAGEGYQDSCQTSNTSCAFQNLPCGLDLNLTVRAHGAQCNSIPSVSGSLQTVPCAPQNVNATLICRDHSALVSWLGSHRAVGYNVTMTGQDGHTHHFQTNATSCQLPDNHCGETYGITVTPYSDTCAGRPSAVYTFRAGLCAPRNITVSPMCQDTTVSWSHVSGAEMFIAIATADDGHNHTCRSNHSNSCNFSSLHCGQTYAVTVVTVDRGCWSQPSSPVELKTALCPAANLTGRVSCGTNTLTLSWDRSLLPGTTYSLQSERIGSSLPPSLHTTANTTHSITNLLCGQRYAFRIAAQDGNCRSSYSKPLEISTAPCQPTNFTAHVDCGTNKGNFSWAEATAAGFYTVEVTGEHGHVASCSSNSSSCCVKLHCGHSYSATLVASTQSCNSSTHADLQFDSAPCLPEDVLAELQCDTNVMNVTWTQTPGSDNYTAWAISPDGHRECCNSTSNSCHIHGLQCGKTYEVAVTSSSVNCEILAGSDYKVQSAPCKPENISVDQNCSTNAMTVKWKQSSTSQNYTVKATSVSGVNATCDSTESSCSFLDLSCGQLYTFTVMGHTYVCISEMSTPIEKLTAPCPPTNVSATLNCTTHKALVSWSNAAADTAYSVQATSISGHNSSCSETGTSCQLDNLVCGQEYSVYVDAMHSGCPGPASAPATLTTEPCTPMNLSIHYNVSTAQVMWEAGGGASSYSVQAVTDQGVMFTCNNTNTSCSLNGLKCGHIFNVSVAAHNRNCDSVTSQTHRLMTEPCPPTNIQASVSECEQQAATVSWQQSDLAVGYVAYLDNQNGHNASCFGGKAEKQCVVSGLMCGTVYRVWVMALGHQYNSSDSIVTTLTSGPCQPSGIEAVTDCEADAVTISWQPSVGAVSYVAELTAPSGHATRCATNHTNCELSSLQCGEEYNVIVKALGHSCNITAQMPGYLPAEPCAPMNLSVRYSVNTAQVMWEETRGARSYSILAVTDRGWAVNCNTTNTSCSLSGLLCGHIYNLTLVTRSRACNNSVTSEPYRLMTEPCPPTSVQASVACEQLTSTVSWQQSHLAVGYVAYFDDQRGRSASCVGTETDTFCAVSGLMCGTVYSVWVKALGQQYNSSDSTVVSLTSAPCVPGEVDVEVKCNSGGAAVVSWNATNGRANVSLTAMLSGALQTLCRTQENSCNVTGLNCGETYNLSLTASNLQCSLTAPAHAHFSTRPCPPRDVAVDLQCGSSTAVLTWEERSGVELYKASATRGSGGRLHDCNSTGSTCQFPGLDCGESYNFTVAACSQGCCSQASSTVLIQTEPCQPVSVSAQTLCNTTEVQISWHQAAGVVNYSVTVTGSLGHVAIHNTTQTLLSAAFPCGQEYNVTVQGEGRQCDSIPSSPVSFRTTPCIPHHLTTYVQCQSTVGSVSWGPSDGATSYVAAATGLDGHTHLCLSNITSCTWNQLHCGEEYTVVVRAQDDNCTSAPSNSSVIYTDPCTLQNLTASVNCDMKVVSLSWDSSNGTKLYVVSAEAGNQTVELSTNVTMAQFSELSCGQTYSLMVAPQNQHCPGPSSTPTSIQTWPCPPTGVSTTQDCLSAIVMVTWQTSSGSDYYTASMQSDTGISNMCMSDSNQCSVPGLTCGHNFSVSVTASNQQCIVTSSRSSSLQSVPCVPTNVSVVMECTNNTALVSWSASLGATQYSVSAHSNHSNVSCLTSALSCELGSLSCGNSYVIQVVALDDNCSSVPSQARVFNTAPCPPQNMSAEVSCLSNDMTISWDVVREADHFLVSVISDKVGTSESCNTTNTGCSISNVTCGSTFGVHVSSVRGACRSQHAQTLSIQSAPCQPQGIRGHLDCVTNSAWISWDAAPGADSYSVSAVGGGDYTGNCTTSSNTTCEVEDLACGVLYNFSVVATNSKCESQSSVTINLQTAPCTLSSIRAVTQCHNSSILVMWELMEGSEGSTVYTATAEARDHTYLSCSSTGTSCYLSGAQCDFQYTIIVAASSDRCSSMRSPPHRISMEPCPPTTVMVNTSCEDASAWVSWSPSPMAEAYHVVAIGDDGHVHTCNTTAGGCSVPELHCEQQYNVFVKASHENCSSEASENVTITTGPCQPDGLSVSYHCNNQSALLSWTPRDNAVDYYGCAQDGNGAMLCCHSTTPTCTIRGLDCGASYNFSVRASDGSCNSSSSQPVQSRAAPCPPDAVELQLMPMQAGVQVMRFDWAETTCNDTWYMLELRGSLLGDNQALFDLSSYWTSVVYYEIPLPCASSYIATVRSRNAAGTSDPSVPLTGTTAPCPPSGVLYSGNSSLATVLWNVSVFATTYTVYDNGATPKEQLCTTAGLSCSLANMASTNLVVTASNSAGESETTSVMTATQGRRKRDVSDQMSEDNAGGLPAPRLNVTLAVSTVVFLKWSQLEGATYYSLVLRKQGSPGPEGPEGQTQELMVYGEEVILSDLSPNSTYCLSLSAIYSEPPLLTSGPESETVCVKTGQEQSV